MSSYEGMTPELQREVHDKLTEGAHREHARAATGLYEKYTVRRNDGSDGPGGKHEGCRYFVLDMTHDKFAAVALAAYAAACQHDRPQLALDLSKWAMSSASVERERADTNLQIALAHIPPRERTNP